MAYLPDDIWYIICTLLWHDRSFNTLFNCACSGKQLASIALTNLYRMQVVAPVNNFGEIRTLEQQGRLYDASVMKSSEKRIMMKCAGLWRTIILSSLGKTLYPYSQYLRTLNLQDLAELLIRISAFTDFFQDDLAHFKSELIHGFICVPNTVGKIGEAITKKAPLLEELIAKVPRDALSRWIPQLPRLMNLKLFSGEGLEGNGKLIRLHCPSFKRLSNCRQPDPALTAFLNELRPQSLESLDTCIERDLGPKSFQALICHAKSLVELKLDMSWSSAIPNFSPLKVCTNLVSLSLARDTVFTTEIEKSHSDTCLMTANWLKECNKLQSLVLINFLREPALIVPILLEDSIQLTSFKYEGYVMRDTKKFQQALANQTSLQILWLNGGVDESRGAYRSYGLENPDILVESLSKLVNLMDLRLTELSDLFVDRHIVQLTSSLPKLEVWSTRGFVFTDAVWDAVASLRSLRSLDLGAATHFTADGIVDFIKKLGPGNKGLVLSLISMNPWIPDIDGQITEAIAKRVEGRLTSSSDTRKRTRRGCYEASPFENESY